MHYKKHIFFCMNKKSGDKGCANLASEDIVSYAKEYMKDKNLWGEGKFRATKTGCLGRCDEGPVCVVYPEGNWYTYVDEDDVKDIIDNDLVKDKKIKRLSV